MDLKIVSMPGHATCHADLRGSDAQPLQPARELAYSVIHLQDSTVYRLDGSI
jgi:hypothetical protein